MKKDYRQMAEKVIEAVGGKDNVAQLTHCVTRLRFNLKNDKLVNVEEVKKIEGVIGAQFSINQFQVIIGQDVGFAYTEACKLLNITEEKGIDENLDKNLFPKKEAFSIKKFLNNIIDALSGCLVPLLPAVIAAGMIKTIAALLGPTLLNVLPETSDTYVILSIVGDAGFYFLPVFCGYSAAKKFNTNILISMLICSVLVHPQLIDIVESGEAFSVFGVPMTPVSYSSNILAPVLIVFVQSYVEKLFQRISPQLFAMIIVPVCTTLVMIPLALCVLGPLGTWIGDVLAIAVTTIHDILGPIAVAFVAAAFMVMVVTGAHITLSTFCITQLLTLGYEEIIFPASTAASFALTAAALAYAIKSKEKKEKSLGFSCAVSNFFGSASEPTIFGIFMPHKRIWGCQMIGALAGGLYLGMTNVAYYALNPHILIFLSFTGGGFANTVNGMIGLAISFVVTFLLVFFFGGTTKKERIIK